MKPWVESRKRQRSVRRRSQSTLELCGTILFDKVDDNVEYISQFQQPNLVNIYFSPNKLSCVGPKKQSFWPRINCSQMKLPNFGSPSGDSSSTIGRHFSNILVILKLKSAKNAFCFLQKKLRPKNKKCTREILTPC